MLAIVVIFMLAALTILMSRAEAFQRLSSGDQMEDLRFKIWGPIAAAADAYFPLGTGPGSIVPIYQLHEPDALLIANYVNQAHNDWLDLFLTTGLFGMLVAASWLLWFFGLAMRAWQGGYKARKRSLILGRLGSVIALLWILASLGDYPLRTPFAICVFVVTLIWLNNANSAPAEKTGSA